mgnify:FL=1
MTSGDIRKTFLNFFEKKGHTIVPSAPMVIKNDPTLMFTNAGMNQFKDWFLGNEPAAHRRVANTQKCLRVSGKHNDLEEVGHDTYHHTMFEMLGNWSFGDYFKKESITWAWELLHQVFKLDADRLYATVFEGSDEDSLGPDDESRAIWEEFLPPERILAGSKKDNFWEMGETGPCGPCSEIHVDLRSPGERAKVKGVSLVNKGHPLVVEIWNLVFIQFNRKTDGKLVALEQKHVDTGMGLERLCMAIQGKTSNYDTDLFQGLIRSIGLLCNKEYGKDDQVDVAMRVISDHLRAICFSIADGQLPSNVKAGYVIRRILRRAVRYGHSFLGFDKPFLCELVPSLIQQMGEAFPELIQQQGLIQNIIRQEEEAFLRALEKGTRLFEYFVRDKTLKEFSGKDAFLLYDTYGFPLDLTILMAREKGLAVNIAEFEEELQAQKDRARKATLVKEGDWVEVRPFIQPSFLGYETTETFSRITRYRKVRSKNREFYHIVLDQTPFYAQSGGQVGDSGYLENTQGEKIPVTDTIKENNLILHISPNAPENPETEFRAVVDRERRQTIANNHTATHLLHYALRQVLGPQVEQKGSQVSAEGLRFDFSHYARMEPEEIRKTERIVNDLIRKNIVQDALQDIPLEEAGQMGAIALFGEKYGAKVRVIRFGESIELCGGTHTSATGNIGIFKIASEGAIAAGVRRIEAITGLAVERKIEEMETMLLGVKNLMNDHPDIIASVQKMLHENEDLHKVVEENRRERAVSLGKSLWEQRSSLNGIQFVHLRGVYMPEMIKDMAFSFREGNYDNMAFAAAYEHNGKANLTLLLSKDLVSQGLHAAEIVRNAARHIGGGGGGQDFYATAGGKDTGGLQAALDAIAEALKNH